MATTRTRTVGQGKSWVEVTSGGDHGSTHVYLVIQDGAGVEMRYELPNVMAAQWEISRQAGPVLRVDLRGARGRMVTRVESGKTSVEDLLAEIAASRLADDGQTVRDAGHAPHCARTIAARNAACSVQCDCDPESDGKT